MFHPAAWIGPLLMGGMMAGMRGLVERDWATGAATGAIWAVAYRFMPDFFSPNVWPKCPNSKAERRRLNALVDDRDSVIDPADAWDFHNLAEARLLQTRGAWVATAFVIAVALGFLATAGWYTARGETDMALGWTGLAAYTLVLAEVGRRGLNDVRTTNEIAYAKAVELVRPPGSRTGVE